MVSCLDKCCQCSEINEVHKLFIKIMLNQITTFTIDTEPLLPIIYYFCLAALSWCNNDDDDNDNNGDYAGDDDDDKDDDDDDGDNDGKDADSGIVT